MIFCIDIGNTNIKYGVFDGDKLVASFRVVSQRSSTADEYGIVVRDLLRNAGIRRGDIEGVIMSSVIPQLNYTIAHMCEYYLGFEPTMVGPGIKTGINVKVDNPAEAGADRLVNSVAAYKKYGGQKPVIAPGIKGSLDSLVNGTAQLPNIELSLPEKIIAKNTITNMQAGLLYGFAGLVEHIVKRTKKELGREAFVVATGGLSETVAEESGVIDVIDRTLTLEGLKIIYNMNKR